MPATMVADVLEGQGYAVFLKGCMGMTHLIGSLDLHEIVVQLVFGIGAILATVLVSILGLIMHRSHWLFVAGILVLGPTYYVAGLFGALWFLIPLLCIGAGIVLRRGNRAMAATLMVPVYFMIFLVLLMYTIGLATE